ncbi:MAG: DUF2341 domain-containing protein [bacterium]|nr:DUF2341 domain-containing protein [bacterium]
MNRLGWASPYSVSVRGLLAAVGIVALCCFGCGKPASTPPTVAPEPVTTPAAPADPTPGPSVLAGEDWPTQRHDIQRSGISSEYLGAPLTPLWTYATAAPPAPAWTESPAVHDYLHKWYDLKPRQSFDRCFDVAVVGERLFFGSSVTGAVTCLDAGTGDEVWVFFSGGPVRFAPQVVSDSVYFVRVNGRSSGGITGRVYFGSDDGFVYCLDAATGDLVWSDRAAPDDDMIWGNQHMISVWPVRTSVLLDGEDVFWTAGIFPEEGMYLCKRNAADGSGGWTQPAQAPPQGYLLGLPGHVVVPAGKSYPRVYSRTDGACTGDLKAGTRDGGSWAIVTPDRSTVWFGPTVANETQAFAVEGKTRIASVRDANCLVADAAHAYYSTDTSLVKLDRNDHSTVWTQELLYPHALIKAGDLLFAGGDGEVAAIGEDGDVVWSAPVDGAAYGLAVARRRLYVSTDTGSIHCFSALGPRVTCGAHPTTVTPASAVLSGRLVTQGASRATVTAHWGTTDGGEDVDGWESSSEAGIDPDGTVTVTLKKLQPRVRYFYRFRAANAHSEAWSATAGTFSTVSLAVAPIGESVAARGAATPAFLVTRSLPDHYALQVSYQVSGSAEPGVHYVPLPGIVTIPSGETCTSIMVEPVPGRAIAGSSTTLTVSLEKGPYAQGVSTSATVSLASEPVDLGQWTQVMQISFPGHTGSEALHDFPVPVTFDAADGFDYSGFAFPSGDDLRFTDAGGTRMVRYEIASWDPKGQSLVWVEVPELKGPDTTIRAYWGNAEAESLPGSADADALWRDCDVVSHADDAGAPFGDAKATGIAPDAPGVLGKSFHFQGGLATLPSVLGIGACGHTVSAWVRIPRAGQEGLKEGERVGILLGDFPKGARCNFEIHADGRMRAYWNGGKIDQRGETDLRDGEWHFIAWTRDRTADRTCLYVDGKLDGSKDTAGQDVTLSLPHRVGGDYRGGPAVPYFHGLVDEFRIARVARTEAWLRTCWESQRPDNAFLRLGPIESVTAGAN